jgi:hypothetical protein
VLSVRPKIAELAFRVFSRGLHPELYTVHQTRRVDRSHYEARIDITNSGHVVTWTSGGVTLCEVVASACQPLPNKRCVMSHPVKSSRTDRAEHGDAIYRTSFQLESVAPEMFWMVGQTLSNESTQGLLHRFDSSGRMALGAISYINIETRLNSMLIQAIHTFPDDYAILKVESLFSLPTAT